jgi:hypothetical protein
MASIWTLGNGEEMLIRYSNPAREAPLLEQY